jgi:rod shape-determining protein MreD
MKKRFFLLALIMLAIFQVTLLDGFKVFYIKPDFLFISVVLAALFFDLKWAVIFGASAGALKDIFSLSAFGLNTVLFAAWTYLVAKLSRKISIENDLLRAVLIFVITFSNAVVTRSIFFFLGEINMPLGIFLRVGLLESLYAAIISPLLFLVFNPFFSCQEK